MKISDTVLAVLSDMHTGSSSALFPRDGFWGGGAEQNHVMPNERQKDLYSIFVRFTGEVAKARKGKRLIVVNLGDGIDGFHHGSRDESLIQDKDQVEAHIQLMKDFKKRVNFGRGDELHYVRGTEVHVEDKEHGIGKELGAVKAGSGIYVNEILELNINSKLHAFVHHGKQRGAGQNEGNSLRNFLRDVRADRLKDKLPRLDYLWSGHTHGHFWNTHIERHSDGFHEFHGIICPSWQAKTRYAYSKVPMAVNSVGGVYMTISADGSSSIPHFVVGITKDL